MEAVVEADPGLPPLEAGLAAGGEPKPVRSASVYVAAEESFPDVYVRVDRSDRPIADLAAAWGEYELGIDGYVLRALYPERA